MTLAGLPGQELIERGLRDLSQGIESVESLLVSVGAPRLRRSGVHVPPSQHPLEDAELRLYRLLRATHPHDAYSRYNSLVRRLIRFERALEHRVVRGEKPFKP
jgi:hypothetical protein